MKKLQLKMDSSGELLNKDQMKKVIGGDYDKKCYSSDTSCKVTVSNANGGTIELDGTCTTLTDGCYCVAQTDKVHYHQQLSAKCKKK